MDIKQAQRAGVTAYNHGHGRAPALNAQFTKDACASGNLITMLDGYLHGWDIANLADMAVLPSMPSVIELAEIMAD